MLNQLPSKGKRVLMLICFKEDFYSLNTTLSYWTCGICGLVDPGNLWLPSKGEEPHIFGKSGGCSGMAGSALQIKCLPVMAEQTFHSTHLSSAASQAVLLLWDAALWL